ncbi:MAG: phosphoribosylformylglycinamidine cyclo-ligase [Planctomycetota bacterium]|nr:phosphoribosylformylglycinamidine cyclo-ligase [Planctomycetota bacterium]
MPRRRDSRRRKKGGLTYEAAGVGVARGDQFARAIQRCMKETHSKRVIPNPGGFAGLFRANGMARKDSVIVSTTDGVGTKVKVASRLAKHDTIGIDLVAMCVNDLLAVGAEPLFFLDYIATSKIRPSVLQQVVRGIATGCKEARCALLGGETAEHPGSHPDGEYDLAGFAVGEVARSRILGPDKVRKGDVLIGLPSVGLHSNGYSLARKVLMGRSNASLRKKVPGSDETIGEALLRPTRIYARPVLAVMRDPSLGRALRAGCHITGGGLAGNLPRVIPAGLRAEVRRDSWDVPPIFDLLARKGPIRRAEMEKTFNMGIGFVLISSRSAAARVRKVLSRRGVKAMEIGDVVQGRGGVLWR